MPKRKSKEEFIRDAQRIHGLNIYDYSMVEYKGSKVPILIRCQYGHIFTQRPNDHLSGCGCTICAIGFSKSPIYGIGENDLICETNTKCHKTWVGMMERCYNDKYHPKEPSYIGCIVCDEWHRYSNFKNWFYSQKSGYKQNYHLDKDIIIKGNKKYSPDTCCFVPQEINNILTLRNRCRGELPIGVTFNGSSYRAQISIMGKRKMLGSFKSQDVAFLAYKKAKEQYIKELAKEYFEKDLITERVYQALLKYEVGITD